MRYIKINVSSLTFFIPAILAACTSADIKESDVYTGITPVLASLTEDGLRSDTALTITPAETDEPTVTSETFANQSHPLAFVASIIEATVSGISYEYDDILGPREVVSLNDIIVHAGKKPSEDRFSQLGGPLGNGTYLTTSAASSFETGTRYIIFFAANAHLVTPVVAGLAFRAEKMGGRDIVIGPNGNAVRSFSKDSIKFGGSQIISKTTSNSARPTTLVESEENEASSEDVNNEIKEAMGHDDFIVSARTAVEEVGGRFDQNVSLVPSRDRRWNEAATVSPK